MAGKEALAFVIDVRQPMGTLTGDDATSGSTRLSAAVRGVEAMVTAKMMQSKQTEAIIVLAGTAVYAVSEAKRGGQASGGGSMGGAPWGEHRHGPSDSAQAPST